MSLKFFKSAQVLFCFIFLLTTVFIIHFTKFSANEQHKSFKIESLNNRVVPTKKKEIFENFFQKQKPIENPKTKSQNLIEKPKTQFEKLENPITDFYSKNGEPFFLPGADNHPILKLSENDLKIISISEMMSWYGEADGGKSCANDFGNSLVNRWRDKKQNYCQFESGGPLGSSIDCHLIQQTKHHGDGDNLCLLRNVSVDLNVFDNEDMTSSAVLKYVSSKHITMPYINFPKGFIKGDCAPIRNLWKSKNMPGWNNDVTVKAFSVVGSESENELCSSWIENKVLLVQRDTFANFFHDSEDFINVFLTLAILKWAPGDTQMFLTDLFPKGPFWPIWEEAYSKGLSVKTAWDLKQEQRKLKEAGKENGRVCFRDLAINIYGPASPITVASWDTPCKRTALIRAYSDYIIRSLNLQNFSHYANKKPLSTITVTYMSRRPSKEWPEKKYCDDENSFFLCKYWAKFGKRTLGRMIRNDKEVILALKKLESKDFSKYGISKVIIQDVDFNELTLKEQIEIDLKTDIMIGPHGAGLMHNIFMRDRATLIELFIDGSGVNRHFHNLAFWFGRGYHGESASNPVDTHKLLSLVERVIRSTDVKKY